MQVKDLEHLLGFRVHVLSPEHACLRSEEKNSKIIIIWEQGVSVMVVIFCILFFV